jgi:hypothetical protein
MRGSSLVQAINPNVSVAAQQRASGIAFGMFAGFPIYIQGAWYYFVPVDYYRVAVFYCTQAQAQLQFHAVSEGTKRSAFAGVGAGGGDPNLASAQAILTQAQTALAQAQTLPQFQAVFTQLGNMAAPLLAAGATATTQAAGGPNATSVATLLSQAQSALQKIATDAASGAGVATVPAIQPIATDAVNQGVAAVNAVLAALTAAAVTNAAPVPQLPSPPPVPPLPQAPSPTAAPAGGAASPTISVSTTAAPAPSSTGTYVIAGIVGLALGAGAWWLYNREHSRRPAMARVRGR